MSTAPTLTDGFVTLRAADGPADVQGSMEQGSDPESIRWTSVPFPYGYTDAVEFVAYLRAAWDDDSEWGFVVEYDGRYCGSVSLRPEKAGRAEIGYGAHPWVRGVRVEGRSVMERAVRLLLDWGFRDQGLRTVTWWAHVGNWASRRLAWKVGFRIEGAVRGYLPQRGELHDAWVGTLRRDDPPEPCSTWLDLPVLRDDAVVLRRLRDSDVPRIVQACADVRSQHWLGTLPTPYGSAHAHAWLESNREDQARGSRLTWGVADPETDLLLGAINLLDLRLGYDAEVGYWTHPGARGRGVMTAATRLVLAYGFDQLGLDLIRGSAALENTASRRVLESVGMRAAGIQRLGTVLRTGRADAARYDLTRPEFDSGQIDR